MQLTLLDAEGAIIAVLLGVLPEKGKRAAYETREGIIIAVLPCKAKPADRFIGAIAYWFRAEN